VESQLNPEFLGITALAWQAISTIVAAAAFIVALVIGWWQLVAAQKVRKEQARPYIVVDILPGLASVKLLDLVVTNIGKSPAFDLTITFDPTPERAGEVGQFTLKDARILKEPTPMFAPGREFRMYFDHSVDRYQSDLPMSFKVATKYRDSDNEWYTETATIDFDIHRNSAYIEVYGVHDGVKTLKDIAKTLKRSAIAKGPVDVVHETRSERQQRQAKELEDHRAAIAELKSQAEGADDES
jgi:hypothetical protein